MTDKNPEIYFTLKGYTNGDNQLKFDLDFNYPFDTSPTEQRPRAYITHDNIDQLQKFFILINKIYLFLEDPHAYPERLVAMQKKEPMRYGSDAGKHHEDEKLMDSLKTLAAMYGISKTVSRIQYERHNPRGITFSFDAAVTTGNGDMRPPR